MGSSLTERAALYRQLVGTLSDPNDVATALSFAELLEDVGRLEVPIYSAEDEFSIRTLGVKAALNRVFQLSPVNPLLLAIMFQEVVDDDSSV